MTLKDELPRLEGAQYATGKEQRNSSGKNEEAEPKQKQHTLVNVTGDGSKSDAVKNNIALGTWNVRSMNQGKLHMVKQETVRVNINIIGISELKWTRMDKFNSDDHYIYHCGQKSLKRNGVALIVNKRARNAVLGYNLKHNNDLCSFPRQIIHITVIQVYAPTSNAEEAEVE